jgi:hypothetical protein
MKITIPIEIEITKREDPFGYAVFNISCEPFLDARYKQSGLSGFSLSWVVENMATQLADALTPTRLTYEITKRLKDGNIDE